MLNTFNGSLYPFPFWIVVYKRAEYVSCIKWTTIWVIINLVFAIIVHLVLRIFKVVKEPAYHLLDSRFTLFGNALLFG